MTLDTFKNLQPGDYVIADDGLYCEATYYKQYTTSAYKFPQNTLFKVCQNSFEKDETIGVQIIIDNVAIPNARGYGNLFWLYVKNIPHLSLHDELGTITHSADTPVVVDIVY